MTRHNLSSLQLFCDNRPGLKIININHWCSVISLWMQSSLKNCIYFIGGGCCCMLDEGYLCKYMGDFYFVPRFEIKIRSCQSIHWFYTQAGVRQGPGPGHGPLPVEWLLIAILGCLQSCPCTDAPCPAQATLQQWHLDLCCSYSPSFDGISLLFSSM